MNKALHAIGCETITVAAGSRLLI